MDPIYRHISPHTQWQHPDAGFRLSDERNLAGRAAKPNSADRTSSPIDDVRLNGAVQRALVSGPSAASIDSASVLAAKVANADPELAHQAFGRIVSAITLRLLSDTGESGSERIVGAGDTAATPLDTLPGSGSNAERPKAAPDGTEKSEQMSEEVPSYNLIGITESSNAAVKTNTNEAK